MLITFPAAVKIIRGRPNCSAATSLYSDAFLLKQYNATIDPLENCQQILRMKNRGSYSISFYTVWGLGNILGDVLRSFLPTNQQQWNIGLGGEKISFWRKLGLVWKMVVYPQLLLPWLMNVESESLQIVLECFHLMKLLFIFRLHLKCGN